MLRTLLQEMGLGPISVHTTVSDNHALGSLTRSNATLGASADGIGPSVERAD